MTREELGIEAREARLSRLREERKYDAELYDAAKSRSDKRESFINLTKNGVEIERFENASPEEAFDILVAEERQQNESRIAKFEELLRTETDPNKLNGIQESLQEEYKIRSMSDEEIVAETIETDKELAEWREAEWKSERLLNELGLSGKQRDVVYFEGLYEREVMKNVSEEQIPQLAEAIKASGKIEDLIKNDRKLSILDFADSILGPNLSEKFHIPGRIGATYDKMTIDIRHYIENENANPEVDGKELDGLPNGSDGMNDDGASM